MLQNILDTFLKGKHSRGSSKTSSLVLPLQTAKALTSNLFSTSSMFQQNFSEQLVCQKTWSPLFQGNYLSYTFVPMKEIPSVYLSNFLSLRVWFVSLCTLQNQKLERIAARQPDVVEILFLPNQKKVFTFHSCQLSLTHLSNAIYPAYNESMYGQAS